MLLTKLLKTKEKMLECTKHMLGVCTHFKEKRVSVTIGNEHKLTLTIEEASELVTRLEWAVKQLDNK